MAALYAEAQPVKWYGVHLIAAVRRSNLAARQSDTDASFRPESQRETTVRRSKWLMNQQSWRRAVSHLPGAELDDLAGQLHPGGVDEPFPCGYLGDGKRPCRCNRVQIERYPARIQAWEGGRFFGISGASVTRGATPSDPRRPRAKPRTRLPNRQSRSGIGGREFSFWRTVAGSG